MAASVQPFRPERAIETIADFIADPVAPAAFPAHILRFRNDRAAASVGLAGLNDAEWIDRFGRFVPFEGGLPQPLALRYHGHQFRVYNPDIGDGRGFLYAQCRDAVGRVMDFGTKGSGQTPYSRFGDGRLTLKGAVREILATEMLEALGVETSRTLSVIETGEALHRGDEPSPTRSAVIVRLSHGHIRIGSFQRLATLGEHDALQRLTDYTLATYFGAPEGGAARLVALVAERTARLAASYMAAGFVHGVLNSDNINVTGESFDYGPWRFAPSFDADFTAAYFDHAGLYAFGRQAEAIHWDLVQLAASLRPLAETDSLVEAVERFGPAYRAAIVDRFLFRLGLAPLTTDADVALVQAVEAHLLASGAGIDAFFHAHAGGRGALPAALSDAFAGHRPAIGTDAPYWQRPAPCSLLIDEVEAIWAPIAAEDDWTLLNAKVTDIRALGAALAQSRTAT